jgi:hypothetical protein
VLTCPKSTEDVDSNARVFVRWLLALNSLRDLRVLHGLGYLRDLRA